MAWSFTATLPTAKDRVRSLIGDVDTTDQKLADETINALLVLYPSELRAAAQSAFVIAASYASTTDQREDALGWTASQLYAHYMDLYQRLLNQLGRIAKPYAGGLSIAEKETREANPDYVKPFARRPRYEYVAPLQGRPVAADGPPW